MTGGFVTLDGELFYRIANSDHLPPFFMSIVSDSDHWMFISSNGALTAGRRNPDSAAFPYTTDDKIHDAQEYTGAKTIMFVEREAGAFLWEPFSQHYEGIYDVERSLYKNVPGNTLVFEEINHTLSLSFRYTWCSSDRFGLVRHATLRNDAATASGIRILDGLQNLLPYGIERSLQTNLSTLVDAYKKNELLPDVGLALFTLSSIPVDRTEPSEALKATTVWCEGMAGALRLVSSNQVEAFRRGQPVTEEIDIRTSRGAYLIQADFELAAEAQRRWSMVVEVNQDAADVAALAKLLRENETRAQLIDKDIRRGTERLVRLVASADGLQLTRRPEENARHFANVLFNIMRGGIYPDGYEIHKTDLLAFLAQAAPSVLQANSGFLDALPATFQFSEGLDLVAERGAPDLERLYFEYLPLTFSRRHGDPSRPWNEFSIETQNEDGSRKLSYQGNWRDIFQNWEALCVSFPGYIDSTISKFVNASTADGYNPYRITREGFEWETLDPTDPWSYIGYWGDHQIIYLLKFLELSERFQPGRLATLLTREIFAYANVPYRMKRYTDLLSNPRETIVFDDARAEDIERRVADSGADGKLIHDRSGNVYRVNLTEKLLVALLAKLSNFIPETGIWMNTQRPEWNDANNALVGCGVSVVTLCYVRRYLGFCQRLFETCGLTEVPLSREVARLLGRTKKTFETHSGTLSRPMTSGERRDVLDDLGEAGSSYRDTVYDQTLAEERTSVPVEEIASFCRLALSCVDHSIRSNRRDDGLYHSYNLMGVERGGGIAISRLYEMLEGQVAVLSSGCLSAREALTLLVGLRRSAIFREDQNSYMLYPDRDLPRFVEKNRIPAEAFESSALLKRLVADGNTRIVKRDVEGVAHFSGTFRNVAMLEEALDEIRENGYESLVDAGRQQMLDLYETVFDHRSFTGRSGTFFGYEGLGCIYWHMVSKLLLAAQEVIQRAARDGTEKGIVEQLIQCYYDIRAGLGVAKTPELYGAFPTDPYSHTSGRGGAEQPGMTGQVKEDFITRMGELGIWVEEGSITFRPTLLRRSEFLTEPGAFESIDAGGAHRFLHVEVGCLAFSFCNVPIVLHIAEKPRICVSRRDGSNNEIPGLTLDTETSRSVFERRGGIERIDVSIQPGLE